MRRSSRRPAGAGLRRSPTCLSERCLGSRPPPGSAPYERTHAGHTRCLRSRVRWVAEGRRGRCWGCRRVEASSEVRQAATLSEVVDGRGPAANCSTVDMQSTRRSARPSAGGCFCRHGGWPVLGKLRSMVVQRRTVVDDELLQLARANAGPSVRAAGPHRPHEHDPPRRRPAAQAACRPCRGIGCVMQECPRGGRGWS